MTEPTDEQFAAAFYKYNDATGEPTPACAMRGRQMLAALQAHGCIPQQQGLTVRQELVARVLCSDAKMSINAATAWADMILALEGGAK